MPRVYVRCNRSAGWETLEKMERYLKVNIRVFAGFLMMFICRDFKELKIL